MIKTIKNILVPLNFSDSADNAITTGIAMCKRHNASLHILQVKKETMFVFPPGKSVGISNLALEAEVAILDRLESKAKAIQSENNINCFYHIAEGAFHNAVAAKAEDFYCDLIILEKPSHHSMLTLIKKNSVLNIIEHVKCPVLTVPSQSKYLHFNKILLPVRPILAGLEKLELALPIIKKNNAKVLLFAPIGYKKKESDLLTIREMFNDADLIMNHDNIDAEKEINFTHDSALEVVNKAIQMKSDLIVISATITKGLKAIFMSDYTEKVIDSSPVPVLSVKLG